MMKIAVIFQDLEHFNNFQTIGYDGHFVFQNEATSFKGQKTAGQDFPWAVFYILKP